MSIRATIDSVEYDGIDTVRVGNKDIELSEVGSINTVVFENTFIVEETITETTGTTTIATFDFSSALTDLPNGTPLIIKVTPVTLDNPTSLNYVSVMYAMGGKSGTNIMGFSATTNNTHKVTSADYYYANTNGFVVQKVTNYNAVPIAWSASSVSSYGYCVKGTYKVEVLKVGL